MPVISSKVSEQESEAISEFANRHGITVSNLIKMLVIREIVIFRVFNAYAIQPSEDQVLEKWSSPEFFEKRKAQRKRE